MTLEEIKIKPERTNRFRWKNKYKLKGWIYLEVKSAVIWRTKKKKILCIFGMIFIYFNDSGNLLFEIILDEYFDVYAVEKNKWEEHRTTKKFREE